MKAFVFSIGEKTTGLCVEQLKNMGFDIVLYQDNTSLWDKLKRFYSEALASDDDLFLRIDADIIPNKRVSRLALTRDKGWICGNGFDWYKQDQGAISIHLMDRDTIKKCSNFIEYAKLENRPESYLWRHPQINPHTAIDYGFICGIHGYGQEDQRDRIKDLKQSRGQEYDWDLVSRIEEL